MNYNKMCFKSFHSNDAFLFCELCEHYTVLNQIRPKIGQTAWKQRQDTAV